MKIHRILIDSAKRMVGHPFDFTIDVSHVTSQRDFWAQSHMCAVEWCDPVVYSEHESTDSAINPLHPMSLLLTCSDMPQSYVFGQPKALCCLQSYLATRRYGIAADSPYCRRNQMGILLNGDTLNRSGSFTFKMFQFLPNGYAPCVQPAPAAGFYGSEFRFQLVFWTHPGPEHPLSFEYFKIHLTTCNRSFGTVDDCLIPFEFATNHSMRLMDSTWFVGVEFTSLIALTGVGPDGLVLTSNTFRSGNDFSGDVIANLPLAQRVGGRSLYGLKLSLKNLCSDIIGARCGVAIDSLSQIHLSLKSSSLQPVTNVQDYTLVFVVYKYDENSS